MNQLRISLTRFHPGSFDAPKGVTRLTVRVIVTLFQPYNAPKSDTNTMIAHVSDALRQSVTNGRFAAEAKAFRKAFRK